MAFSFPRPTQVPQQKRWRPVHRLHSSPPARKAATHGPQNFLGLLSQWRAGGRWLQRVAVEASRGRWGSADWCNKDGVEQHFPSRPKFKNRKKDPLSLCVLHWRHLFSPVCLPSGRHWLSDRQQGHVDLSKLSCHTPAHEQNKLFFCFDLAVRMI